MLPPVTKHSGGTNIGGISSYTRIFRVQCYGLKVDGYRPKKQLTS